jgi:hypothetical protein
MTQRGNPRAIDSSPETVKADRKAVTARPEGLCRLWGPAASICVVRWGWVFRFMLGWAAGALGSS